MRVVRCTIGFGCPGCLETGGRVGDASSKVHKGLGLPRMLAAGALGVPAGGLGHNLSGPRVPGVFIFVVSHAPPLPPATAKSLGSHG